MSPHKDTQPTFHQPVNDNLISNMPKARNYCKVFILWGEKLPLGTHNDNENLIFSSKTLILTHFFQNKFLLRKGCVFYAC